MGSKSYGTVSPEQQKAMSGLEFVKGLASGDTTPQHDSHTHWAMTWWRPKAAVSLSRLPHGRSP